MSYILDALKRADTERTRGAVPGLHARQLPSSGSAAPPLLQQRLWLLMVAAGVLGAMAAGLWVWRTPTDALGLPVPMLATPTPLAPTTHAQPKAAQVAKTRAVATANASAPTSAAAPQAAQASAPRAATSASAATPPSAASITPPAAPAPAPLLSELPDALRRQLPKLTITGTVYAEDPKQRLLLVNNQVLPQGSVVAPELTLEEIRPRSSVFNFQGTRFRVAH